MDNHQCVASSAGLLVLSSGGSKCMWAVSGRSTSCQHDLEGLSLFLGGTESFKQFATTDESGARSSVTAALLNGSERKRGSQQHQLWLVAVFTLYVYQHHMVWIVFERV